VRKGSIFFNKTLQNRGHIRSYLSGLDYSKLVLGQFEKLTFFLVDPLLKDAPTLLELDNDTVANICKAISKEIGQSVAKTAATKLKLACFWVRHQMRTLREIGGTQRPLMKVK
jgi:hypothetical protein